MADQMTQPRGLQRTFKTRTGLVPVILALVVFAIDLVMMPRTFLLGDPFAWREETLAILRDARLSVDPAVANAMNDQSPGEFFDRNEVNGRYYSKYGLMNSLMAIPPMLVEKWYTGRLPDTGQPSIVIFNLYCILISVALALMLWLLTGRYSSRGPVRFAFVLIAMYTTYLWYYQRAQSGEIYQTLFFTGFFYCTVRAVGAISDRGSVTRSDRRWLLAGWLFLAALVYTRAVFGILLVSVELAMAWAFWSIPAKVRYKAAVGELPYLLSPPIAIVLVQAWINRVKFGSVWLMGYQQWRPQDHLPTGPMADGLWGILFSPQWSIFLYFPILAIGLFAARPFWKRFRADSILLLASFLPYLLLLSKIPSWRGEWAYGPRYFLFALPALSMPFVLVIEWFWQSRRRVPAWIAAILTIAVLGYSTFLQFQVNGQDFFLVYRARAPLEDLMTDDLRPYFYERHAGLIVADLVRCQGHPDDLPFFPALKQLAPDASMTRYRRYLSTLMEQTNLYWWPPKQPAPTRDANSGQPEP